VSMSYRKKSGILLSLTMLLLLILGTSAYAESYPQKQLVYDYAKLLSVEESARLGASAASLGRERQTDFIVITLNGADGKDIVDYVEDFYDDMAPGYDKPHGNAAILAIDLQARDVFLAGFGIAETYLDDERLDRIRNKITPYLTEGRYYEAFSKYISLSHDYMGYEPGVNPENILFKWWFQIAVALAVAGVTVGMMAYRSGGRVTVNAQTYMDANRSQVLDRYDNFVNQTVTRTKIQKNTSSGGGGGGGMTGGGRSHSGSRGKF
jgi:uncharacterized protein